MDIGQLKIKTPDNYNWDDIIYINDFDTDSLKIIKRESKIGVNIYYIKYNTLRPFYFVINHLIGYIEEIELIGRLIEECTSVINETMINK